MIVQQPLFFFHHTSRQWHTSLLGQGGLHRHHHYKKERQWQCNGTRSRSGDHWRQCNRDFRFDFGRISAFYHHAMIYTPTSSMVPTSPSTTRNLCFSKLLPPAHEYLHICTPWIGRARVISKIVLTFWHLSFQQCVRFPVAALCDMKSCSHWISELKDRSSTVCSQRLFWHSLFHLRSLDCYLDPFISLAAAQLHLSYKPPISGVKKS